MTNAAIHDDLAAAPSAPEWPAFVRRLAGAKTTQRAISIQTGVDQSTVNRWFIRRQPPSVQAAVAVARAYGVDPVKALIAAGILTEADLNLPPVDEVAPDLREVPMPDLIDEIARRAAER